MYLRQVLASALLLVWGLSQAEAALPPSAPSSQPATIFAPPGTHPTSDADVRTALRRILPEVHYDNVPLQRVLDDLCAKLGTNTVVERAALTDAGVDLQAPITLTLRAMPAEHVLRLALEEANACFRIEPVVDSGILRISTLEDLGPPVMQLHDMNPLLAVAPGQPPLSPEAIQALKRQLARIIQNTIAPDRWDYGGGMGTLNFHGNALVVYNDLAVQRDVAGLIHAMAGIRPGQTMWLAPGLNEEESANRQTWTALQRVLRSVTYQDAPLSRVVDDLRRDLGINVHVFANASVEAGLDPDHTATLALQNVTAERMLREVLDQLTPPRVQLDYEVRNGVLLIGPPKYLQREIATRVYDLAGLIGAEYRDIELARVIQGSIEPDSWDIGGGKGTLNFFRGRLVVHNYPAVHRKIERLLADLRQHPAGAGAKP